jgi:hypothetical protein
MDRTTKTMAGPEGLLGGKSPDGVARSRYLLETSRRETANFANAALPGAPFFEMSGTFTNGGRRVPRVNDQGSRPHARRRAAASRFPLGKPERPRLIV